jgi:WD40 repeat protein
VSESATVTLSPILGRFTSSIGKTIDARDNHTATLLPGGKILLAGGSMHEGALHYRKNAELFDPVSGTSPATGFMMYSSASHTATLLGSGKVLLTGGWDGFNSHKEAQLFDPAANAGAGAFSFTTGSMNSVRALHTATLLGSGKVLITGGYDGSASLSSAELYDPGTGTFTPTGSMAIARMAHTATLLNNGKVLIAGGTPDNTLCELYDPNTGTFTATGRMNLGRSYHTATVLSNGPNAKVLIAGGASGTIAELYDPVTGTFGVTNPMTTVRTFHTATLLSDTRVLLAGGSSDNTAELYDPNTRTFAGPVILLPPGSVKPLPFLLMNEVRASHTATLLPNGLVFIAGGTGASNKTEQFK